MSQHTPTPPPEQPKGRGLAWVAIVVGVLIVLGLLSSVANGTTSAPADAAERAGEVVGRLIGLVVGVLAILWGVRRLRR